MICRRVATVGLGCCRRGVAKELSKRCVRDNGIVCLLVTVLFCAKDFNAAFRMGGCILRSANPEGDLENMVCTAKITAVGETGAKINCLRRVVRG
jgi:hypothetical protein